MEKCTFFNDVDDDRIYFAEDLARHLAAYFTNGIFNNSCQVLGENNDMSISINIGSANINGYRYDNDTIKILNIENADGILSRVDNIVIRLDLTNRMITSQVIKGSFSENPVAPPLVRTATVFDLRIAKISIPAGTTTITQDLITDTRFITSDCGNVVGAVQQINTDDIFAQYQSKFNEWFLKMKDQLDTDAAGNLQSQIDDIEEEIKNFNGGVTGDTLPIGSIVDYDGDTVPANWEKVEDENIYSTAEQEIGEWFGKKLYRKTLVTERITAAKLIDVPIANIDMFWIDASGTYMVVEVGGVKQTTPMPMYKDSALWTSLRPNITSKNIELSVGTGAYCHGVCYITILYTKTTDEVVQK